MEYNQIQVLEGKVCTQTATSEDKAIIKKYYYKNQFEIKDEDEMAYGFDNRFNFFFERLSKIKHDNEHLYYKIAEYNNWNCIFPTDDQINKVKLNGELIDRIFNEYDFKDIKKNSTAKVIIKHIYNEYFVKNIIKSKTKDKKNYKLYIGEDVHQMFKFGMASLKTYQKREELNFEDMFNDA